MLLSIMNVVNGAWNGDIVKTFKTRPSLTECTFSTTQVRKTQYKPATLTKDTFPEINEKQVKVHSIVDEHD